MADVFTTELSTAAAAVRLASKICSSVQANIGDDALQKKDRSPVTIADYASQAVICRELRTAFPDDPIVAEEDARELRSAENASFRSQILMEITSAGINASEEDVLQWIDYGNHDGTSNRFWTLDPIDGTKGFLRKDQFAVSLAMIVNGKIQVAALACPNLEMTLGGESVKGVVLTAARGAGTKVSPIDESSAPSEALTVSNRSSATDARICESVESGHSSHGWSAIVRTELGTTADPVRIDSQVKYAVVAAGVAEVYLRLPVRENYEEKIWDHAGGVLVVEEAGGRVTDINGSDLDFSQGATLKNNQGVVVTNGKIHTDVLNAIESGKEN